MKKITIAAAIGGITLAGALVAPVIASPVPGSASASTSPAAQPAAPAAPSATARSPQGGIRPASLITTLPAPVIATVTTYAAPGSSNCAGPGACARIWWYPVSGATYYSYQLSVVNPDGSLSRFQQGTTTDNQVTVTGLTADSQYGFQVAGEPDGLFSQEYRVDPETCGTPQPYGPEQDAAARTQIWDGESWQGWVDSHTPGEFVTSLQLTLICEPVPDQVSGTRAQVDLLNREYMNGEDFTQPMTNGMAVWHLAAP